MSAKPKISVLIVTGFLGAGKTSFINHLLLNNKGVKIGLIENEFGDVSIAAFLLANNQPESIIELNNGCICCSIFNEFSLALQELVKKHDYLEQLIIETTGIADPGPIIGPFYKDPDLIRLFELSGVICLVDAVNFREQMLGFEQLKQILLSDMIVINKINDSNEKQLSEIRKKIATINLTATIFETNYSRIETASLNTLQAQLTDDFIKKVRKPMFSESDVSQFHSFTIRFGGFTNEIRFREWFGYFAFLHKQHIYRIKGIVYFDKNPLMGIVQSVGGVTYITEGSVHNPYEQHENILTFIGKRISKFEIEKEIQQFLLQEN